MTEPTTTPPPFEDQPTGAPPVGTYLGTTTPPPQGESAPTPDLAEESTVGMGTSIALGCVAATILLIVIGLVILLVVNLFS